jgi:exopolysaccharide biosynthesis WecB/TagA/CpsF family protein
MRCTAGRHQVQATRAESGAARSIGGVAVIVTDRDTALADLRRAVADRAAGAWGFCNAHTVNCARTIPGYRETLSRMRLLNDGIGVDLASRLLYGDGFPDNLNGTDLSPALLESLPPGTGIFLIGSPPGVAERAGAHLGERFPHIRIVGTQHGFFPAEEEPAIAARIAGSGAHLVLVGMGNPVQEQWAVRNAAHIAAPLLCIGAYLDFAAGIVSRAPGWVRKSRTEWLYRLAQEPRRLASRYLVGNLTFLAAVAHEKWARR